MICFTKIRRVRAGLYESTDGVYRIYKTHYPGIGGYGWGVDRRLPDGTSIVIAGRRPKDPRPAFQTLADAKAFVGNSIILNFHRMYAR